MKINKPFFKQSSMESQYLKVLKSFLECPKDEFDATYFELLCTPLTIKNCSRIKTTIKTVVYVEMAETYWKCSNEENAFIKELEAL